MYRSWSDYVAGAVNPEYPTMPPDEIAAIPVASWAKDDESVLALWATLPKLDVAMAVLAAWGFVYTTAIPWIKTMPSSGEIRRGGMGFWALQVSELLLIAKRGEPPSHLPREQTPIGLLVGEPRVFYAPSFEHSRKPIGVHEWLMLRCEGPYLELFAREVRAGWTCYGFDTGFRLGPEGATRYEAPLERLPLFDRPNGKE